MFTDLDFLIPKCLIELSMDLQRPLTRSERTVHVFHIIIESVSGITCTECMKLIAKHGGRVYKQPRGFGRFVAAQRNVARRSANTDLKQKIQRTIVNKAGKPLYGG